MAPAFPDGTADMQPERDHLRRFFRHSKNACGRVQIALVPGARIQTMGAYVWQAKLLCNDRDVSTGHQILRSLGGGFHLPSYYAPCVRIIRFSFLIFICMMWTIVIPKDASSGIFRLAFGGFRSEKLLAITCDGRVKILDTSAEDLASISVRHPKFEYPAVFWWRDGRRILVISRTSQQAKTRLSVFDSTSGRLLGITGFDPADLLPYDQAAYTRIGRHRYSLNTGSRRSSVEVSSWWSRLEFDIDQCLLRGAAYRPEGPCEQKDGAHYVRREGTQH